MPGLGSGFGNSDLINEFEGDEIEQDNEFVKIWRLKSEGGREQVASIRLGQGHWVQEIPSK